MKKQFEKLLKNSAWISILVFIIICFVHLESLIRNFSIYSIYEYAGNSISFTVVFMVIYEKYLWKYNPFNKTPVLRKSYEGELFSSFDNLKRNIRLEIKQTLLSTHIIMLTNESKSISVTASIDEIHGENYLTYCYINTPKTQYRDKSEIHYGTAVICIDNTDFLSGSYYTDRKTRGSIEVHAKK